MSTKRITRRDYRVLLVDIARSYGGAEVRTLTQARALQEAVTACTVVTLAGSQLHQRLEAENLPVIALDDRRSDPRMIFTLRNIIRRGNYQVVDAHNVQSILWGHLAAALAGARGRVATIHSDYGGEYSGIKGLAYESVLYLNRLFAHQYINVTDVLQVKSVRQGLGDRSTLIHNAVPVPVEPWTGTNTALRSAWGIDESAFVVGIIARLKPVKGHRYLLDAMAALDDLPQVKLVIVGDGPLLPDLEAQAAASGITDRVIFAGFRQDIDAVLQAVDAVCMASLSEAQPYAVLEAMSYARPLLVTAVGGMATLLDDHETALLVPPQDAAALAKGLRWLATFRDDARTLGLNAYQQVRDTFSVEMMITQVLAVYDRALDH